VSAMGTLMNSRALNVTDCDFGYFGAGDSYRAAPPGPSCVGAATAPARPQLEHTGPMAKRRKISGEQLPADGTSRRGAPPGRADRTGRSGSANAMISARFAELRVSIAAAAVAARISESELRRYLDGEVPSADRFFSIMAAWGREVHLVNTPRWERLERAVSMVHNAAALELQPAVTSVTAVTLDR